MSGCYTSVCDVVYSALYSASAVITVGSSPRDIDTTVVIIIACIFIGFVIATILKMPMPGVRCPRCAERGIEQ